MSKETEAQSQRIIVASDMTCTVTFSGDRQYTSQDLQNLIAQLDMQRALMDGENFSARAHITSAPVVERKPPVKAPRSTIPVLPAKAKADDDLAIPDPDKVRVGRRKFSDAVLSMLPTGNPRAPAPYNPTPEELARTVDDMDTARQA